MCPTCRACVALLALAGALAAQPTPPLRQVAPPSATSADGFGLLLGVRALGDGRVLVNDGANKRLVLLDASLRNASVVADSAGSTGLRYGATASPITAYLGDSTLFMDRAGQALLVLDPQGKQVRVSSVPKVNDLPFIGGGKSFVDPRGRLIYRGGPRAIPRRDTGQAVIINTIADSAPIVRADFDRRAIDTAGTIKLPNLQENHRHRQPDGTFRVRVMMFGLSWTDDWTMLPDGTIAIVRGQDYHVDWIAPDGARSSTAKMPFDWRRIDDVEQKRLADSAAKETQAFIDRVRDGPAPAPRPDGTIPPRLPLRIDLATGVLQVMPADAIAEPAPLDRIPDYYSAVRAGSVSADLAGNLWILPAATAQVRPGVVYDVVNRQGQIVERVELPPGRSIVEHGPNGALLLMHKDASGVWRLERRRVAR